MSSALQKIINDVERLLEWGNRDAAYRRMTQAIRAEPKEPRLWYWLARTVDSKEHAIDALERAIALDPTYREARIFLETLQRPRPSWQPPEATGADLDPLTTAPESEPPEAEWRPPEAGSGSRESSRIEDDPLAWLLEGDSTPATGVESGDRETGTLGPDPTGMLGDPPVARHPDTGFLEPEEAAAPAEEPAPLEPLFDPEPSEPAPPGDLEEPEGPEAGPSAAEPELTQTDESMPVADLDWLLGEDEALVPDPEPIETDEPPSLDLYGEEEVEAIEPDLEAEVEADTVEAPDDEASGPEITLDWLVDESGLDATGLEPPEPIAPVEEEPDEEPGSRLSFLDELDLRADQPPTAPTPTPDEETLSFLEALEISGGEEPLAPPKDASSTLSFLEALEDEAGPAASAGGAIQPTVPPPLDEDDIWRRAAGLLGIAPPPPGAAGESGVAGAAPGAAESLAPPSRGAFSFHDAPPSIVTGVPLRSTIPPLGYEQIEGALSSPTVRPTAAPSERRRPRLGRLGRVLSRVVVTIVSVGLLGLLLWLGIQNADRLVPENVLVDNPAVATRVVEAQLRSRPRPAPPIRPDWVVGATEARFDNRLEQAEAQLRDGLADNPTSVAGLVELSRLRRDLPDGADEAAALATEALIAATSTEERALATEALVWAALRQPSPDVAQLRANAEQAAALTPGSPYAQWALGLVLQLEGEGDAAAQAVSLARYLAPRTEAAETLVRLAEFHALRGETDPAIGRYRDALGRVDYIPWRLALVDILRQAGRDAEAEAEIEGLVERYPDHPLVTPLAP